MHVIGPELGLTQPGMTIVCGDSHTATHGAFGALAFGIGTSEVGHVLATQCLLQRKPKTLAITVDGELAPGVGAKDLILHVIGVIGVNGGTGHVIEYRGSAIRALSMEQRMTVCNMSIEAGARAGLIAPDETTFDYLRGHATRAAGRRVRCRPSRNGDELRSDDGARFDREVRIDARDIRPTVTWGTHPGQVVGDRRAACPTNADSDEAKARDYMGWEAGRRRWPDVRSTWSSSAAAPTRACPTCAKPRACCAAGACIRACACWSCRARSRSSARPKPRASTASCATPARNGASRAARCASR